MSQSSINNSLSFDHIEIPNDLSSPRSSDYEIDSGMLNDFNILANEMTNEEKINNNIEKNKDKLIIDINISEDSNKKVLGRKKIGEDNSKSHHTKFSDDNTRRKIKRILMSELQDFINQKIEEIYGDDIGEGMIKKRLMKLCQKQISNASIEYNQKFLNKILKDIFSEKVTGRVTNFSLDRNKEIVEELINDECKERGNYFKGLFNVTFLDCLKYFRGDDDINIEYIKGLNKFSDIKENFEEKEGKDFTKHFSLYLKNYEKIIINKKPRKCQK